MRINVHVQNANFGDHAAAPAHYVPSLQLRRASLFAQPVPAELLVVGGGGLQYHGLWKCVQAWRAKAHRAVAWGIGTNTHGTAECKLPPDLDRFDLVGLRDFGTPFRWVPCASCLAPEFDVFRQREPIQEVVAYYHHETQPLPDQQRIPALSNDTANLARVLTHMATAEVVVTNTYHGAYWATLLGRRVLLYPFSSRHHHFKHQPFLVDCRRRWRDVMREARAWPDALEECRAANAAFAADVSALG